MKIKVLTLDEEVPLKQIPNIDFFSENYAWHGYDFKRNIGFYSHMGRWSEDRRNLWRESLYIYLPDKTTLSYRGYGSGDCTLGAAAAVQKQVCRVPGSTWTITHHGPARRHHLRELTSGPVPEATPRLLNFEANFTSTTPAFLYDQTNTDTYGRWHYEQLGSVAGAFHFGGHDYAFSGMGFRDHSRGPRKLTHFVGNNWIQGLLPDGRGFAAFEVWKEDHGILEKELSRATLIGSDAIVEVQIVESPSLSSLDDLHAPITLILDTPDGQLDLRGEPLNTLVYSVDDENNTTSGTCRGSMPFVAAEQPVLFTCNGQKMEGHVERCRKLGPTSPLMRFAD